MDRYDELVKEAFAAPEPRAQLRDRLNRMATEMPVNRKKKFRPLRVLLLGVALLAVVGFAYNAFFKRTGEAAISMIPSDASMVVTVDLVPGENQVAAFKRISDAIAREGLDSKLEKSFSDVATGGDTAIIRELRPYITRNLAFASWKQDGAPELNVLLLSVTDPKAVQAIIAKHGTGIPDSNVFQFKGTEGSSGFHVENGCMEVLGSYLAVGSTPAILRRVELTVQGGQRSVADLAEYREARNALPSDANLMFFAAPSAWNSATKMAGTQLQGARWVAFGAAIRDNGIQIDYRGPVEEKLRTGIGALRDKPIATDLFKHLPAGALGLWAASDLTGYYRWIAQGEEKADLEKGIKAMEESTGLSMEKDIAPAFQGDIALAVYTGPTQEPADVDALMMMDGQNGAKPVELCDKLRALVERESKGDEPVRFTSTEYEGATVWSLDEHSEKAIGDTAKEIAPGKTFVFATVGETVYLASSKAMLYSALRTAHGEKTLAEDGAFSSMSSLLDPKASGLLMLSPNRILEKVRPWLAKMNENGKGIGADDLVGLFGGPNDGLVFSGHMENDVATGTCFVPLDWDKAAHVVSLMSKAEHSEDSGIHIDASPMSKGSFELR